MIKISVDEGAAFDILSIAAVKANRHRDNNVVVENFSRLGMELAESIGQEKCQLIVGSPEYQALLLANLKIYDKIDAIKRKEHLGDAAIIDSLNHDRYLAKKAIQEKFFNSHLSEQKFGYKND